MGFLCVSAGLVSKFKMEDRVKRLNEISSVLEKSRNNLKSVLTQLGWSKEFIQQDKGNNVECPLDKNHRMPLKSLKKHAIKCKMDKDGIQEKDLCPSSDFYYTKTLDVTSVDIDDKTYNGFKNLGQESSRLETQSAPSQHFQQTPWHCDISDVVVDNGDIVTMATKNNVDTVTIATGGANSSSAQGACLTNKERLTQPVAVVDPSLERIRAICHWSEIPGDYYDLELGSIEDQSIRNWLLKYLPKTNFLSSVPSGDTPLVNFIMSCLKEPSVANPKGLEGQLTDLLGKDTKNVVLELWKFLAISVVCQVNAISETDRLAAEKGNTTKLLDLTWSSHIARPMSYVDFDLTPAQRSAMHDYIIETAKSRKRQASDDAADVMANVDGEAGDTKGGRSGSAKSHLETLAEMRDYKRRRQSYRAKNVHMTKRSAVDVMRDLIETQMKVLEEQLAEENNDVREATSK